jgi:hypothetical protein
MKTDVSYRHLRTATAWKTGVSNKTTTQGVVLRLSGCSPRTNYLYYSKKKETRIVTPTVAKKLERTAVQL